METDGNHQRQETQNTSNRDYFLSKSNSSPKFNSKSKFNVTKIDDQRQQIIDLVVQEVECNSVKNRVFASGARPLPPRLCQNKVFQALNRRSHVGLPKNQFKFKT